ncbi:hypothetical protein [Streptomyces sp. URMC 129]|uniref:hypothetical protein n=1 Tax=Streptomyces sp. URMC 129 TaxID=3423407 RepID=UPI003F1D966F
MRSKERGGKDRSGHRERRGLFLATAAAALAALAAAATVTGPAGAAEDGTSGDAPRVITADDGRHIGLIGDDPEPTTVITTEFGDHREISDLGDPLPELPPELTERSGISGTAEATEATREAEEAVNPVTLTVEATDRDGAAATSWRATFYELTRRPIESYSVSSGDGTVQLPPGEYLMTAMIGYHRPGSDEYTGLDWLVRPSTVITEDTTLTLDAAEARDISMAVPDDEAELTSLTVGLEIWFDFPVPYGHSVTMTGMPDGIRTAYLGPESERWRVAGSAASTWETGERLYQTAEYNPDAFFHGLTEHPRRGDLARITTGLGASVPGLRGVLSAEPVEGSGGDMVFQRERELPQTLDVFVEAAEGPWRLDFYQFDDLSYGYSAKSEPTEYEAGERYRTTFNVGVFGPMTGLPETGLFRTGNEIHGLVRPFSDGAGHLGFAPSFRATTTLYRDGEEYRSWNTSIDRARFDVPPDEAAYELVSTVRPAARAVDPGDSEGGLTEGLSGAAAEPVPHTSVSTEITTAYTFTSAAGPDGETVRLPASSVRFSPRLALDSTSPAGETLRVPFTVEGSAADGNLASLAIDVSYDGGETWSRARVLSDDRIRVTNPPAGGTVSFRAEVEDAQGNSMTQTIIDAYRTT